MANPQPKRQRGRPPAGVDKEGKPAKSSQFPKLSIYLSPPMKASLNAVAVLENRPLWLIVEDSLRAYIAGMPPADRKMVEAIARRTEGQITNSHAPSER